VSLGVVSISSFLIYGFIFCVFLDISSPSPAIHWQDSLPRATHSRAAPDFEDNNPYIDLRLQVLFVNFVPALPQTEQSTWRMDPIAENSSKTLATGGTVAEDDIPKDGTGEALLPN